MAEQEKQHLAREKALYRYSYALEQGDFDTISTILAQAQQDAVLEHMILEINEAYTMTLDNQLSSAPTPSTPHADTTPPPPSRRPWHQRLRPYFSWALVGVGVLIVALFAYGLFQSNRQGDVFDRVSQQLGSAAANDEAPMSQPTSGEMGQATMGDGSAAAPPAEPKPDANINITNQAQPLERLIIRNGSIQVSVADTLAVKQEIETTIGEMADEEAFVVSSQESGGQNGFPTIYMTIRVPATRFEAVMDQIANTAVADTNIQRTETAEDVTAEYIDLSARLESLEAARQRLLELMQDAPTTEELLMAEQQLTQREAEIDALQGRLQFLSQSAQLSRIDITLLPYILNQPFETHWRPAETVRRAFESLLESGQNIVDFTIFLGIAVLPWLLLLGIIVYLFIRFIWRPRQARRQ